MFNKPGYPLFKVKLAKDVALDNLVRVFDSGFLNEGEEVSFLTSKLRDYLGVENIILTNSGTSALTLALKACGLEQGDEVLTVSMTCLATNTPIINHGGKIVWVDIDPHTGSIDVADAARKATSKTKAIIFVNWAGNPCDLESLAALSAKTGLPLIQDAAHSFGATWQGSSIAEFADFTCFSFQAIKHFTTGDGGAIVCRRASDYELVNKLKWFGLDRGKLKDEKGEWRGQRWNADVLPNEVGYKFNMNNISAAIGLANLAEIENVIRQHRINASIYDQSFRNCNFIKTLSLPEQAKSSYWVYTLRLACGKQERDLILSNLNAENIEAGLVHVPNHYYSAFAEFFIDLPGTDEFHNSQISLPCGWWMNEEECKLVANRLLHHIDKILGSDDGVRN